MSSYLGFRKDGVPLCWFSGNTEIYQALGHLAKFDDWSECTADDFSIGLENLEEDKQSYEKTLRVYKEMINHELKYEDLFQTLNSIQEIEETLKEIEYAKANIQLLSEIASEETADGKKSKMEWIIS